MGNGKVNLLFEDGRMRSFRRQSGYVLLRGGVPERPITWNEWHELNKAFPADIVRDGLSLETTWFLVETTKETA